MKWKKLELTITALYIIVSLMFLGNYTYHQNEGLVKYITLFLVMVGAFLILSNIYRGNKQ